MTNLRDKITDILQDPDNRYTSCAEAADAILALPETAGWTALEGATEALVNAESKLAEVTAERDRQYDQNCEQIARIAAAEAMLPRAYRVGVEDACKIATHYDEYVSMGAPKAIRALPTPTAAELVAQLK